MKCDENPIINAYKERANRELNDPEKTIMLQLAECGYADYNKNLRLVRKDNQSDINTILDKLGQDDSAGPD